MFKSFAYLGLVVVGQVAATAIDSSSHQIVAAQTIGNAPDTLTEVALAADSLADTKSENLLAEKVTAKESTGVIGGIEFLVGFILFPLFIALLW